MVPETPTPTKKHKVIAWKPETSGPVQTHRHRLSRRAIVLISIGVVLLLYITVRTTIVLTEFRRMANDPTYANPEATAANDPSLAFAGRSRAESSRQTAMRNLENARKVASQHPSALQMMVEIERVIDPADKAFGDRDYPRAIQLFDLIATRAEDYATAMADMRKAQEMYNQFILDMNRLNRFKDLAPADFEAALTAAGSSQLLLDQGSFTLAREQMDEAARILQSVQDSVAADLEQSLANGRAALAEGNGDAAVKAFDRALELQPENELAALGRKRAENIDRLFGLLREAGVLETTGRFEDAQNVFERAFALDSQSATAQAGISRMKAAIKKRDFDNAVARAQTARENHQWAEAIAGYEDALKIQTENADVKKLLADARVREREARVQTMLDNAYAYERTFEWNEARRVYLELLAYQPGQVDAEEGLLRTGKVLRALLKFERLLEDARAHAGGANFEAAIGSFNEAMASKPAYLELAPDQLQLKNLLELQSKPVPITFVSDGRTWVTISGVKLLGKFEQQTINVMPGNYEVIGRRKGYEDVREFIRVRNGEVNEPVTMIATRRSR